MPATKIKGTALPKVDVFYAPNPGSFSRFKYNKADNTLALANEDADDEFEGCREIFLECYFNSRVTQFLFSHASNERQKITDFMAEVDDRLGNKKGRIQIVPTASNSISIVYVSQWWRKDPMRRALLTILLRSGRTYNKAQNNFTQALYSNKYAEQTKEAVEAFFRGRTVYKGKNHEDGWVTLFGEWLKKEKHAENRKFYKDNLNNLVFDK